MNKGPNTSDNPQTLSGRILEKILPDRTKRLIFVSSFLAHIQICDSSDRNLISKLNLLLDLSADDNALVLPMQWHERIWSDVHVDKILHDKGIEISNINQILEIEFMSPKVRTLSEDIIKAMPKWLKYDSNTRMRSDLIKLFRNIGDLLQTPVTA